MGHSFPSIFLPEETCHIFYPLGNKVELFQGRVRNSSVSNSLFHGVSVGHMPLQPEMHLKIPSVILICPQRSCLLKSYWGHLCWLTCPPWCFSGDTGAPVSSHMPIAREVALSFCAFTVCVLGYFPCSSTWSCLLNPMLYRVRRSLFGFRSGSHSS